MEEKWPGAYNIVSAYTLSNDEMSAMVGEADLDGVEIDTVVANWMETNKDRWSGWVGQ
jgi:glycine betaine/proline transport system substrate-binding protein